MFKSRFLHFSSVFLVENETFHSAKLWFASSADGLTPFLTLSLPVHSQTSFKITKNKPISVFLSQILEEDASIQSATMYEVGADGEMTRLAR